MSDRTQCTSPSLSASGSAPGSDASGSAGTTPPPPPPPPDGLPVREDWEDAAVFRETFLAHFGPSGAEILRRAGVDIYELVMEHLGDREPPTLLGSARGEGAEEPAWVETRLRAMAEDLRFGEQFLESVGRERFHSSLQEREARLAEEAEGWADDLRLLAEEIELALELPGGPTPV